MFALGSKRGIILAAVALATTATFAPAATISTSASQPAVGANDVAQLLFGGTLDGSSDYTDNTPPPGQSFTTPSSAATYQLTAVTVKGNSTSGADIGRNPLNFNIIISSVSGTSVTTLASESATAGSSLAGDEWLTFTLATPLTVTANTVYGFEIDGTDNGYYGIAESSSDVYAGGVEFTAAGASGVGSLARTATLDSAADRTFIVSLSANGAAVPEPATLGLLALGGTALLGRRRHA